MKLYFFVIIYTVLVLLVVFWQLDYLSGIRSISLFAEKVIFGILPGYFYVHECPFHPLILIRMRVTTLPDIRTEGDIKTLVDSFCQKVRDDEVLAPVFNAVARIHWPYYLTSMYQFWSSTLLTHLPARGEAVPKNLVFPTTGPPRAALEQAVSAHRRRPLRRPES